MTDTFRLIVPATAEELNWLLLPYGWTVDPDHQITGPGGRRGFLLYAAEEPEQRLMVLAGESIVWTGSRFDIAEG